MNKLIFKSLAAIGLMGLAYYMANPGKYNDKAKKAKGKLDHTVDRARTLAAKA